MRKDDSRVHGGWDRRKSDSFKIRPELTLSRQVDKNWCDLMRKKGKITSISLFASGGIGDLALRAAGGEVLVANELLEDRAQTLQRNFPETYVIQGDVRKLEQEIVNETKKRLNGNALDVLFATPPCQGMSKNGRGKLLQGIRLGVKPKLDERNTLIINAVNIIKALQPRLVVFENVPEMENTIIEDGNGSLINIMDLVRRELKGYRGTHEVVEFADYGVPQRRQRLITVFSREPEIVSLIENGKALPARTHAKHESMFAKKWVSVDEALKGVPPLDAKNEKSAAHDGIPFHTVPVLDEEKYFWVSNTPPGKGSFDNQCVNPGCRFQGNPTHSARHDSEGINRTSKDTPIRCLKCGNLLPRPWVNKGGGDFRLMSGFTSAYKRMRGDLPASALTSNLSYACSDQKIHPTQHRVLSLYEAFILHTIVDFDFVWERADGKRLRNKSIREIIGESIPPRGLKLIFDYLLDHLEKPANVNDRRTSLKERSVRFATQI